jgi:hypothetical protein
MPRKPTLARNEVIKNLQTRLGSGMVDVELDPDHYNLAVDRAITRYRQRAANATEESGMFLTTQKDVDEYFLPNEVLEVRKIYRRAIGSDAGSAIGLDPFDLAFTNLYVLQAGRVGGVSLFDTFSQYQEVVGRIFGSEMNFTWHPNTHRLNVIRRVKAEEQVLLHVYNEKPENELLRDRRSRIWLEDFSFATCKIILGEARGKYGTLPGAAGGIQLNGDALKAEGQAELERLEGELQRYTDGSEPPTFIIG